MPSANQVWIICGLFGLYFESIISILYEESGLYFPKKEDYMDYILGYISDYIFHPDYMDYILDLYFGLCFGLCFSL